MRLPINTIKFAQEYGISDKLYKKFRDYINHYKKIQFKIDTEYDDSISFEEKSEKMDKDIRDTISKIVGTNKAFSDSVWRNTTHYKEIAFATINSLIDSVLAETIITDFQQFAEVKYGGWGDTFTFDHEPGDLFTVTKFSRGKRHAFGQRQYTSQSSLQPKPRAITVEEDYYRILCGKRNLAEYAIKVILAFEEQMALDIYNAINDTYSSLGANFKLAAYTQKDFIQLCERIEAANGGARTIAFGTKSALSDILPTSDYLKMGLGNEYVKVGYLRDFMGVDLMPLRQKVEWKTGNYGFRIDNTRIYIISTSVDKLVKVAIEGNTLTFADQPSANANLVETQTIQKNWEVGLITGAQYGILDL